MLDRLFENINGAVDVFLVRIHRHQSWNLQSQQQFILTHTLKTSFPHQGLKLTIPALCLNSSMDRRTSQALVTWPEEQNSESPIYNSNGTKSVAKKKRTNKQTKKNAPNWKTLKHDRKSRDNLSKTMCHLVLNRVVPLSVWCQTHSLDVCLKIAGNPKTNELAWPYRNTPTQARGAVKVYLEQLDGSAVLLLSAQLGHLDENWQWVTWILGLKTGRHFPTLVSLRQKNKQVSAVKCPLADTTCQLRYLVGVHGQEGFVELDSLKLLLHQFVFDTFSICKFNFFLWVKHILVLWKQVFHNDLWHLISEGLTEWLLRHLTNTYLVYCDDVVCSYSQQSHIWRPAVDRHELNPSFATFAKTYIKLMNPTLTSALWPGCRAAELRPPDLVAA